MRLAFPSYRKQIRDKLKKSGRKEKRWDAIQKLWQQETRINANHHHLAYPRLAQRRHFLNQLVRAYENFDLRSDRLHQSAKKIGCPDVNVGPFTQGPMNREHIWSIIRPKEKGNPEHKLSLPLFVLHAASRVNKMIDVYRGPFFAVGTGESGTADITIKNGSEVRVMLVWNDASARNIHNLKEGSNIPYSGDLPHAYGANQVSMWSGTLPKPLIEQAKRLDALRERIEKHAREYRNKYGSQKQQEESN